MHDGISNGVVGAFGGARSALGRGAGTVAGLRPRPQRPLSATVPGGLGLAVLNVARSAFHLAAKDGAAWVRRVRKVVSLGSPRVVGDTLVLKPSASGGSRTRKLGFEDEHGLHLGATNHIALLNHPAVYEKLGEWLR